MRQKAAAADSSQDIATLLLFNDVSSRKRNGECPDVVAVAELLLTAKSFCKSVAAEASFSKIDFHSMQMTGLLTTILKTQYN